MYEENSLVCIQGYFLSLKDSIQNLDLQEGYLWFFLFCSFIKCLS